MIRYEQMSDIFHKVHLGDSSCMHFFAGPDVGEPHDHPWDFRSEVHVGGYVEEIYDPLTGSFEMVNRHVGDIFWVPHNRVHRIVALLDGPCVTRVWAEPPVQEPGFWKWEGDAAYRRPWNDPHGWVRQ